MKHVFFMPWVGKEYATGGIFGKRILVLGESHYGDGEPSPDTTVRVFEEYLGCPETVPSYLQSFHKFERSLVGSNTDCTDRKRIWDSVVFYNYLQTSMSGPRQGGKKSDYANSSEAFFEVLEEYRPEYIIVWGYRLWDNMPTERWKWGEELMLEGVPVRTGGYLLADGTEVKAVPVKHPSTAYVWADWHKDLQPFLQLNEIGSKDDTASNKENQNMMFQNEKVSDACSNDDEYTKSDISENIEDCKILKHATHTDIPLKIVQNLYGWHCVSGIIKEKYTTDIAPEQLLRQILQALRDAKINWHDVGYKRTIEIMDKIVRDVRLRHGQILVSLYLNTYCKRDKKIHIQIENFPAEQSFTNAPENIDYPVDIPNSDKLLESGISDNCIFSIENKERAKDPYILCQHCNGAGKIKCPSCKGSGREQYVDGYFASGEERIKTGACPICFGSGKIDCPKCNGLGKIEIFAPEYSIIKSVSEHISQIASCAYATPWSYGFAPFHTKNDKWLSDAIQQNVNNNDFIRILNKNSTMTSLDNSELFTLIMNEAGVIDYYNQNATQAKKYFAKHNRGDLVCQNERHYLLPISCLTVKFSKDNSTDIYLLPNNEGSTIALLRYSDLGETGTMKYLFYKLFK